MRQNKWKHWGLEQSKGHCKAMQVDEVAAKLLSRFSPVQLLATPWTAAYQVPPSMGFSRQEYWSGLPLPSSSPRAAAAAAAAAKSLQSCPTLCDPRDGSTPGSPVPGILQARTLEWVAISFSRRSSQPRDRT